MHIFNLRSYYTIIIACILIIYSIFSNRILSVIYNYIDFAKSIHCYNSGIIYMQCKCYNNCKLLNWHFTCYKLYIICDNL